MKTKSNHTTTIDDFLWYKMKVISVNKSKKQYTTVGNLIEEGLEYICKRNKKFLPPDLQHKE
jgi:hypothetical protein